MLSSPAFGPKLASLTCGDTVGAVGGAGLSNAVLALEALGVVGGTARVAGDACGTASGLVCTKRDASGCRLDSGSTQGWRHPQRQRALLRGTEGTKRTRWAGEGLGRELVCVAGRAVRVAAPLGNDVHGVKRGRFQSGQGAGVDCRSCTVEVEAGGGALLAHSELEIVPWEVVGQRGRCDRGGGGDGCGVGIVDGHNRGAARSGECGEGLGRVNACKLRASQCQHAAAAK